MIIFIINMILGIIHSARISKFIIEDKIEQAWEESQFVMKIRNILLSVMILEIIIEFIALALLT